MSTDFCQDNLSRCRRFCNALRSDARVSEVIRSCHPKEQGQLNCHTDILRPPSSCDNNASVRDTLVTRRGMETLCSRKDVCGPSSSAGIITLMGDINSRLAWRTATVVHIWLITRTLSATFDSHYVGYTNLQNSLLTAKKEKKRKKKEKKPLLFLPLCFHALNTAVLSCLSAPGMS